MTDATLPHWSIASVRVSWAKIVFSIAAPIVTNGMSTFDYAASIFCGLVIYNVFAELIAGIPSEN